MITLECFNKKELLSFLDSDRFKAMPHLPISEIRGHAHVLNPNAREEDILLIVAFDNEKMAGYLGVLPCTTNSVSENSPVCGWYSCLWVDISQRGKGVSKSLLRKGFELWENQVLLAEYVPATKKMYDSLGVFKEYAISGTRLYIRSDFGTLLPPKHKVFRQTKSLIKGFDLLANTILDLRFQMGKPLSKYTFDETKTIDSELAHFIAETRQNELFPRDIPSLQWLLDNPWVRSGKVKTAMEEKYYFTSVANRFEFRPVMVKDSSGQIVAYFIFALRDNHLKTPYVYSKLAPPELADIVYHFINKWHIGILTTFQTQLAKPLQEKRFPVYHTKSVSREFLMHADLMVQIDWKSNPIIQDGAGDSAFT